MSEDLQSIYRNRFMFDGEYRTGLWKLLCRSFFQRYVPEEATVLDVAAGYCEFINNIRARKKIAQDRNEDVKDHAGEDVRVVVSDSTGLSGIKGGSVDVVFVSNLFEHLTKAEILKTLGEIRRVMVEGGRLLILQPNYRFCCRDYWMFFDHITPLDDRSLVEALELKGFTIERVIVRFLPYTTKRRYPRSLLLVRLYLIAPVLWRIFGQQSFVVARK